MHSVQIITIKGVVKNTQLLRSIQIKNMEHEMFRRHITIYWSICKHTFHQWQYLKELVMVICLTSKQNTFSQGMVLTSHQVPQTWTDQYRNPESVHLSTSSKTSNIICRFSFQNNTQICIFIAAFLCHPISSCNFQFRLLISSFDSSCSSFTNSTYTQQVLQ